MAFVGIRISISHDRLLGASHLESSKEQESQHNQQLHTPSHQPYHTIMFPMMSSIMSITFVGVSFLPYIEAVFFCTSSYPHCDAGVVSITLAPFGTVVGYNCTLHDSTICYLMSCHQSLSIMCTNDDKNYN